jgi:hypothetical protein
MAEFEECCVQCDAVLTTVDDVSIPVHRAILADASPFFRALFISGCVESFQTDLRIGIVRGRSLRQVVQFAYIGKIDVGIVVDDEALNELWTAASFLLMDALVDVCNRLLAVPSDKRAKKLKSMQRKKKTKMQ